MPPDGVTPATIFGSSIVSEFFTWARANYDRVIIDAPPFGIVGDVVSLAVLVDSTIIMCCPDRTHFKPIQYCSRTLTEAGANILGVVVNDVEVTNSSAFNLGVHRSYNYHYGYGYGYGYGHRHKKSDVNIEDEDNSDQEENKSADTKHKAKETVADMRSDEEQFADED